MKQFRVCAIDDHGNVRTGYEEVLAGVSSADVLTDWRYHHIHTVEGPICHCGETMTWANGFWSCPLYVPEGPGSDEHDSWFFDGAVEVEQ